jgi:hypothetical protein
MEQLTLTPWSIIFLDKLIVGQLVKCIAFSLPCSPNPAIGLYSGSQRDRADMPSDQMGWHDFCGTKFYITPLSVLLFINGNWLDGARSYAYNAADLQFGDFRFECWPEHPPFWQDIHDSSVKNRDNTSFTPRLWIISNSLFFDDPNILRPVTLCVYSVVKYGRTHVHSLWRPSALVMWPSVKSHLTVLRYSVIVTMDNKYWNSCPTQSLQGGSDTAIAVTKWRSLSLPFPWFTLWRTATLMAVFIACGEFCY